MTAIAASPTVRERPILFSGEMVCAILDGRKTQTRRVVRIPKWWCGPSGNDEQQTAWALRHELVPVYGEPGDRLYVRETWGVTILAGETFPNVLYPADGSTRLILDKRVWDYNQPNDAKRRWRPSIHMPRWMSRLTLEVAAVRVERLQAISAHDACSEGPTIHCQQHVPSQLCRLNFSQRWNILNAKRGYGWGDNPWVWVVEFRRVDAA